MTEILSSILTLKKEKKKETWVEIRKIKTGTKKRKLDKKLGKWIEVG